MKEGKSTTDTSHPPLPHKLWFAGRWGQEVVKSAPSLKAQWLSPIICSRPLSLEVLNANDPIIEIGKALGVYHELCCEIL